MNEREIARRLAELLRQRQEIARRANLNNLPADNRVESERITYQRHYREQPRIATQKSFSLVLFKESIIYSLVVYVHSQSVFGNVAVLFFIERTETFPPDAACSSGCVSYALVSGPACQLRCEDGWGQFGSQSECNSAASGGRGTYTEYGTVASWSLVPNATFFGGFASSGWTPYFNDPWFDCFVIKAKNGDIIQYHDPNALGGWEERPWVGSLGAYTFAEVNIYFVGRLRRYQQGINIVYDLTGLIYQGNYYPSPDWPSGTSIIPPTSMPPTTGGAVFIFFKQYSDIPNPAGGYDRAYYDLGYRFGTISGWASRAKSAPPVSPYPPGLLPSQTNPDGTTNVVDIYLGGDRPTALKLGTYKRLLTPGYWYNFRAYVVKLSPTESEVIVKYGITTSSQQSGTVTEYKRYWCFADVYLVRNNQTTKATFTRPQEIILDTRNWAAYALKSWEAGDWEPATGSTSSFYAYAKGYFIGKYRKQNEDDFNFFDAYLSRYRGENNNPGIAFAYTGQDRIADLAPYFGFRDLNHERMDDLPSMGGNFIVTESKTYLVETRVRQWDAPRNNVLINTIRTSTQAIDVELEAGEFQSVDVSGYGRHYERKPACKSISSKIYPLGHSSPWIIEISAYVAPEEIEATAIACKNNRIFRARFAGVNSDTLMAVYDYGYHTWAEKYPFDPYWEEENKKIGKSWFGYIHSPGNSPNLLQFRDCNGTVTSTIDAYNLLGGDQLWIVPEEGTNNPNIEIVGECS